MSIQKMIVVMLLCTESYAMPIQQESLSLHNKFRARHHAPNLVWDEKLANYAQQFVNRCEFHHSGSPYGENIAAGYPTMAAAINAWYGEHTLYSYNSPGFSHETGHFTQVVWKSTRKLGCAVANCQGRNGTPGKYWVCEYSPHGNVINRGFFRANVLDH